MATEATAAQTNTEAATADGAGTATGGSDTLLTGAAASDTSAEGGEGNKTALDNQGAGDGADPKAGNGDKSGDEPAGVPEKYELSLPEGVTLDETAFATVEPILRDLGLNNEQASKLGAAYATIKEAESKEFVAQVAKWGEDVKADAEIGGDKFESTVKLSQAAFGKYASPELRAFVESTGLGNHPELIRMVHAMAKDIPGLVSDKGVTGDRSGGSNAERSLAERMYPNHK